MRAATPLRSSSTILPQRRGWQDVGKTRTALLALLQQGSALLAPPERL